MNCDDCIKANAGHWPVYRIKCSGCAERMICPKLHYNVNSINQHITDMTELEAKLAEARAALAQVEADMVAATNAQKSDKIAQVKALMAEYGITLQDLGIKGPALKSVKAAPTPKYRNSAGLTWAGLGKRPNWLRKALADGFDLAEFKIAA